MKSIHDLLALLTIPALEQITSSLGTLVFMLLAARLLGPADFGVLALFWTVIQIPTAIFFAVVLLPLSAQRGHGEQMRAPLEHGLMVYLLLLGLTSLCIPFLLWVIAGGQTEVTVLSCVISAVWLALHLAYEFLRWSIVRFGSVKSLLVANIARWLCFLGLTLGISAWRNTNVVEYLAINFVCLGIWFTIGFITNRSYLLYFRLRPKFSRPEFVRVSPLLASGIATAGLNYALIAGLSRYFSLEVVGAVQAFRSVANFFGTLSQFIDNHFTAQMARSGRTLKIGFGYLLSGVMLLSISIGLSCAIRDLVSNDLLGREYMEYSFLFVILTSGAVMQLLVRPVAAQVRLTGRYEIFLQSSALVFFLLIPITIFSAHLMLLEVAVVVASLAPAVLILPYIVAEYRGKMRLVHNDGDRLGK